MSQTRTDAAAEHLQELCARGSALLVETNYIEAERVWSEAEGVALGLGDYDTLSRLYFPLQETRRQKRQRCGEGVVRLDLLVDDGALVEALADAYPQGQLLVIGKGNTRVAAGLRREYLKRGAYAEVFLGAVFQVSGGGEVVAVVPFEGELAGEGVVGASLEQLQRRLPAHSVLMGRGELPVGAQVGTPATFARTMDLWEQLAKPYLAQADAMPVSVARLAAYRQVVAIDSACELAYQNAAKAARELSRQR